LKKRKIFFRGGEAVVELWEDELLLDDDFSDEEEDAEEQIEETGLEIDADGFADWEDSSDTAPVDETLEEALAEEHTLELESELEQDEHPRDYHAELEDEEEEAAPTRDSCRGVEAFRGSSPDRIGFSDCGRRMEQAGQEPGAPGA
jgi:hypothetical protein